MNTKCCSSYCLAGSSALIFSPSSGSLGHHRLAARTIPACGAVDLSQYTLPRLEKHSTVSCVCAEQLLDEVLVLDRVAVLPRRRGAGSGTP
jgi:hypothetical protein